MRVEVVGRRIAITDTIRVHVLTKADKLKRHFDGVQQVTVTISHEAGVKDDPFDIEVLTDVAGHEEFVARARGSDVYGAIERALDKCDRQLVDHKDKLRIKH